MVSYTKKQFGEELNMQILSECSNQEISKWAFNIYLEHGLALESGLDDVVMKLIAMDGGPEFALSKDELMSLADGLVV
ncbi:MAG: hypothetical protein S4CHLAM102_05750 [Chlamydiia bacterium]|nr:hypothetical protein [Chlamydiia bacterium]